MFDSLAEKLQGTLSRVRGRGTLTEEDIEGAMREIRLALLEADVNFKVVKDLVATLTERCRDAEIAGRLNAGQQVVKIVAEGLAELMGGSSSELEFASHPPTVILMAGLQGSGKTTASAKLARHLREERGSSVALAACDTQRPAAVEQLVILGERAGVETYERGTEGDPVEIARWALERARDDGKDVLIVDTAGRLHVDEALMDELGRMREALDPDHVLLVVDAMTGQDAVNVAERFAEAVDFDGIVMSKLDGDARGGAALSVKALSGRPIVFASTGERLEQFERFYPDRMAQRILGMGDVTSLIEKAEREFDEDEAQRLERKLRRNEFGLDDFLAQLKMVRRMGPLTNLLSMIPGFSGAQLQNAQIDEREIDRIQAIVLSMTPEERRRPELIKARRRLRIARGSGTSVQQVSALIKQFAQMRDLMRQVGRGRMPDIAALMRGGR
ncbi:MAG TPA: signal recognition particle protein [Solirubrobacteraceae bacterium]|nr:signal recognition particle protein [Solirubrobacteraceae bacterium]